MKKKRKIANGVFCVGPLGEIQMSDGVIADRKRRGLSVPMRTKAQIIMDEAIDRLDDVQFIDNTPQEAYAARREVESIIWQAINKMDASEASNDD